MIVPSQYKPPKHPCLQYIPVVSHLITFAFRMDLFLVMI